MTRPKQHAPPRRVHEDLRVGDAVPEAFVRAVTRGDAPKRQKMQPKRQL